MKNTFKTVIVTLLLLTILTTATFAAGSSESTDLSTITVTSTDTATTATTADQVPDFSTLDLQSASLETIKASYQAEIDAYNSKYSAIYDKMVQTYKDGNVDDYFDAKGMLQNLSKPTITEEQTQVLVDRILAEQDQTRKDEFASWLYQNSRYYRPSLTFTSTRTDSEASSQTDSQSAEGQSSFTYNYKISATPGSTITIPNLSGIWHTWNPLNTPSDTSATLTPNGIFVGWGTDPDTVLYQPGAEITMPYTSQTLTAVYKTGVLFIDPLTGTQTFTDDSTINAPTLTPPDETFVFSGWQASDGKLADGSTTLDSNQSEVFTAQWKSLLIEQVYAKHYRNLEVPANTQFSLNFSIYNQGTTNSGSLTISLVPTSDDSIKNLTGDLTTRGIRAGAEKYGAFNVVAFGNSGDTISVSIVATDTAGNTWTTPVTITIK